MSTSLSFRVLPVESSTQESSGPRHPRLDPSRARGWTQSKLVSTLSPGLPLVYWGETGKQPKGRVDLVI